MDGGSGSGAGAASSGSQRLQAVSPVVAEKIDERDVEIANPTAKKDGGGSVVLRRSQELERVSPVGAVETHTRIASKSSEKQAVARKSTGSASSGVPPVSTISRESESAAVISAIPPTEATPSSAVGVVTTDAPEVSNPEGPSEQDATAVSSPACNVSEADEATPNSLPPRRLSFNTADRMGGVLSALRGKGPGKRESLWAQYSDGKDSTESKRARTSPP
jgi:hypothetical protein